VELQSARRWLGVATERGHSARERTDARGRRVDRRVAWSAYYLYQQAPDLAPRLDCIIKGESGWDPSQVNRRTKARPGPVPPVDLGHDPARPTGLVPFEPRANIDAAIWLAAPEAGSNGRSLPLATAAKPNQSRASRTDSARLLLPPPTVCVMNDHDGSLGLPPQPPAPASLTAWRQAGRVLAAATGVREPT